MPVDLYGSETWYLISRKEYRLRVFENSVLRGISGPKRDEMTGGLRKLHNEELLCQVRIIKSKRMSWAGQLTRMGIKGMHIEYWLGSQKERDHWEDPDVGGKIIFKWILREIGWEGLNRCYLIQARDQ
jgi:hypothetical protein